MPEKFYNNPIVFIDFTEFKETFIDTTTGDGFGCVIYYSPSYAILILKVNLQIKLIENKR